VHYSIDSIYMGLLMRKLHRAVEASWKATQGMLLDVDTELNNGLCNGLLDSRMRRNSV
jgi:hypothetical protein